MSRSLTRLSTLRKNGGVEIVRFSIVGDAIAQTYSARKYMHRGGRVSQIVMSAGTAPSGSALTLQLKKNGADFMSPYSVADSGNSAVHEGLYGTFAAGDYLQVSFSSIGSGTAAADVLIEITVT